MHFRFATPADAPLLARLNQQLIQDEGHRNPMTLPELQSRMLAWLEGEYRAVLFHHEADPAGYALYRHDPEYVYLRQFFICRDRRREGVGRRALDWLVANAWAGAQRIRTDVLTANAGGIAFWRSVGFQDYCLTMEKRCGPDPAR